MGLSMEELKQIQKEFTLKYTQGRCREYVGGSAPCSLRTQRDKGKKFALREGESLADLCLSVKLKKEPPTDLGLPPKYYKGVRIFYEAGGNFILF